MIPRGLRVLVFGLLLGAGVLLVAQTTGKHSLMQEDIGVYNAALSAPGTLSSATLTQAQSDVTSRCGTKCSIFLTQGAWSLTTNHTITQPLVIPYGTRVTIANGMTLTLAACPKIDQPLWLQPGTTGVVNITAPGCAIEVHKYATGGAGTAAAPYTGWEHVFTQSYGRHFVFAGNASFQTSTPLLLADPSPANAALTGNLTIEGRGPQVSTIYWQPTGTTPTASVPAVNATGMTTWLTIGAVGKTAGNVTLRMLDVETTDRTSPKRAFHLIDLRSSQLEYLSVGQTHPWHDDGTSKSIAFHLEGRGQNVLRQFAFYQSDYPMILDGTPNEGGDCYTLPYLNGGCEFDSSTVELISLEVTRGYYNSLPWVPHANLTIGAGTLLHRVDFKEINCNGGSSCIDYRPHNLGYGSSVVFDSVYWEDPCPLSVASMSTARINAMLAGVAGVTPNRLYDDDRYGDNAALSPSSAWGWMILIDGNQASYQVLNSLTLRNISPLAGGNGILLRRVTEVTIQNFHLSGDGIATHTYPGQLGSSSASPPATANMPIALDDEGSRLAGPDYPAYPVVCIACAAGGFTRTVISTDLALVFSTPRDPIGYDGGASYSPFPSATVAMWDSIKDTNPSGGTGIYLWTPLLQSDGTNPTVTYTAQSGTIAISPVGAKKLVVFQARVQLNTITGGTGVARLVPSPGDPFPTPSTMAGTSHQNATSVDFTGVTLSSPNTSLSALVPAGSGYIALHETGSSGGAFLPVGNLTAGAVLSVSGSYIAD